jgi:hypothetical protein
MMAFWNRQSIRESDFAGLPEGRIVNEMLRSA